MALLDATATNLPVIWVNDAFERVTGYGVEEARRRQTAVLEDTALQQPDLVLLQDGLRAGREIAHTIVLRRADGTRLACRAHLSPVRAGDDGPLTHWVAALQDLTEQLSHDAEQAAMVETERRERRSLGLIAQVSDLLMDVDDPHALREIATILRRAVVGWAAFYLNDGGLRVADGIDAGRPPTGKGSRHGEGPGGQDVAVDAVQQLLDAETDRPVELALGGSYGAGSASAWLAQQADAELGAAPHGVGRSVLVFPLPGRRRVLGVLVVHAHDGHGLRDLEPSVRTVLDLTARRVGLVIDNARLYDREHRLAETLQRAMLPEQAEVDGLDVWTYYAPNSENAQVGGDWYDVLQVSQDVVGVVIGDVVGHDVEAAASMGQLRSVVRSYIFDITTPGPVLERVDQLVAGMRVPRPAGLVLSTLRRTDEVWRLEYSRAGHLPALLVRGGTVTLLDAAGGPLIGFGGTPRATGSVDLEPGDVVVYYTDGLIERRDRGLRDGLAALSAVAAGVTARDAAGVGEELLSRLADHPEDDVAVVVVRVPSPLDTSERTRSPRRRRWSLPSEAASIGRARHAVVRTCQAWGIEDAANAELVVSELVANAVLHGFGHVSLQLYDTGDGLRIEVEDANPAPPVTTDGHPGRVGGFGMQIVERLADWGWRQSRGGKLVWAKVRPGSLPAGSR
ncbi:SpoIIE family protein phosphatase [Cellulomonas sp. Leaf334]|uniref:ATP-binding SpoIIE family protein phosphatase n=1 Tax=Cellulomonas sp. Leaf334 TaxID=1736339 RepID=UPI0009EAF93C|nr:SpoIIE family protein phosphatase [Cellulomonas sp. Leaf334]